MSLTIKNNGKETTYGGIPCVLEKGSYKLKNCRTCSKQLTRQYKRVGCEHYCNQICFLMDKCSRCHNKISEKYCLIGNTLFCGHQCHVKSGCYKCGQDLTKIITYNKKQYCNEKCAEITHDKCIQCGKSRVAMTVSLSGDMDQVSLCGFECLGQYETHLKENVCNAT